MTCDQQRFLKDCAEHELTIVRDEGVNRHLRFKKPGTNAYWFDIVTWPGVLCVNGDCGAYMFSRLEDMFEFFRTKPNRVKEGELHINPQYWMEKLRAVNKNSRGAGDAKQFSLDVFKRRVIEWFRRYTESRWYSENREDRWAIWEAIREVLEKADSHDASYNYSLLRDFEVWFEDDSTFKYRNFFDDFWEVDCTEYDFSFIWNCYAIAWAITQYDLAQVQQKTDSSANVTEGAG